MLADIKDGKTGHTMRSVTLFFCIILATSSMDAFAQEAFDKKTILSIRPDLPVFVRQGDHTEFHFTIQNTSDSEITGQVQLELADAANGQPVDGWFMNTFPNQYFTIEPLKKEVVKFPVEIPYQFVSVLKWKVTASSDKYRDIKEHLLPVVSNKYFNTDKIEVPLIADLQRTITINKLAGADSNENIQNHGLVFEYSSGTLWYLLQALIFLKQYPYKSIDNLWNQCFAAALTQKLATAPSLASLSRNRSIYDTTYLSAWQKDNGLSTFLSIQSPWVFEQAEWQQIKAISMISDSVGTADDLNKSLTDLQHMQLADGAFPWFDKGKADHFVTQYILAGIGRLKKLEALHGSTMTLVDTIASRALVYLDKELKDNYKRLQAQKLKLYQLTNEQIIDYLYTRSFFTDHPINRDTKIAFDQLLKQVERSWSGYSFRSQAMIALVLHRMGKDATANKIAEALKKTVIDIQKSQGTTASAETDCLVMECLKELHLDTEAESVFVNRLIATKETYGWKTPKVTADACYALLLYGINPSPNTQTVDIKAGTLAISNSYAAGGSTLSYFKRSVNAPMIKPEMGTVTVTTYAEKGTPNEHNPSWLTIYWQYFNTEKPAGNTLPVLLKKKLFLVHTKAKKRELTELLPGNILHVGDTLSVNIDINSSQNIEYLHLQDINASNLEPLYNEQLKWQGTQGYYETCETAGIHLFYPEFKKGTQHYTYDVIVAHAGSFTNGITSAQKFYAPESNVHINGGGITAEE